MDRDDRAAALDYMFQATRRNDRQYNQTAAGPPLRGAFYSQDPPMEAVRGPDGVWRVVP